MAHPGEEADAIDTRTGVDSSANEDVTGAEFYQDEGESEGEEDQQEAEELPAIEAPVSWKAEHKDVFAGLPREAQEIISARESERDKHLQAKSTEAAQTEQRIMSDVRSHLATLQQEHADALEQYARMFQPQAPNMQLLYTNNPDDAIRYQREEAAFRATTAQQHALQQEIVSARQQAEQLAQQNEIVAARAEMEGLQASNPDWFEAPLKLKRDVIERLQPIGEALGYPPELMAQARAVDFKALQQAFEWKVKADKLDALNKDKMTNVRAARKLPPAARPQAQASHARQPNGSGDYLAAMYPDD